MDNSIVLHDYFRYMEGGGRLSLILAKRFKTDLGYGFKIKNHPYFNEYRFGGKEFDLKVFGYLPGWRNIGLINAFKKNTGFVRQYKTVIYSGFYAPLAVENHSRGRNIYYCHTPPRYIYDQRESFLKGHSKWFHPIIRKIADYHKSRYETAISRMDTVITNSYNVKKRIKNYLVLMRS